FYLPMALLGFHPVQFLFVGGINLLYQFWIHTEHIDKLPRWFEYLFNTPSHHRVHHGRNPKYIDRNYAGIWIIWDRLFGTFKEEEERPVYGITTPLKSWNPVYANFAHYIQLFHSVRQSRSVGDGLKMLFNKPGWFPDYMGGYQAPHAPPDNYEKYDAKSNTAVNIYVLVQFAIALLLNVLYFFKNADFLWDVKSGFALWIVLSTLMFGLLFESRSRWIVLLETVRLLSIPLGLYWMGQSGFPLPLWTVPVASVVVLISLLAFFRIYRKVYQPVDLTAKPDRLES
ncbi:MAG: sterol desaturase family protein, partial [Bacteroidota bacterium]